MTDTASIVSNGFTDILGVTTDSGNVAVGTTDAVSDVLTVAKVVATLVTMVVAMEEGFSLV